VITARQVADLIRAHDADRPRSKQTSIGPSGLGAPCSRQLAYHALAVPPVDRPQDILAAWVGTAAHALMEQALAGADGWRTELECVIPGYRIPAHVDAYHQPTGTVVDWKFVGDSSLAKNASRMSPQYRTQVHLYGFALQAAGLPVSEVAVVLIPRNGGMHRIHVWHEPYDEEVVEAALDRWQHILTLTGLLGEAALPLIPTDPQAMCGWCRWHDPVDGDTAHLQDGCPGAGKEHGAYPRPWQPTLQPPQQPHQPQAPQREGDAA
jgi:hypothetical protein